MYGIIHGGSDPDLRRYSTDFVANLPFDGFALGGTLGKDKEEMLGLMRPILPNLPPDKPRHVLGEDVLRAEIMHHRAQSLQTALLADGRRHSSLMISKRQPVLLSDELLMVMLLDYGNRHR